MQILLASISAARRRSSRPAALSPPPSVLKRKRGLGPLGHSKTPFSSPPLIAVGHLTHPPNRCHRPSAAPPLFTINRLFFSRGAKGSLEEREKPSLEKKSPNIGGSCFFRNISRNNNCYFRSGEMFCTVSYLEEETGGEKF